MGSDGSEDETELDARSSSSDCLQRYERACYRSEGRSAIV